MTPHRDAGRLWIVATPIGSLGDLGERARAILEEVDLILAEDTRRARKLLSGFGIPAGGRLRSLHEHNEARRVERVLEELAAGRSAALISDAGTPALSDPGFLLVRAARRQGFEVLSVPGPSAFTAALAASGQPPLPSLLVGFLPPRPGSRRRRIRELAGVEATLVVLLSPHRLGTELEDLATGLGGGREATLLAEISKRHERSVTATLEELAACSEAAEPRGEYVVVIAPPAGGAADGQIDSARAREMYDQVVSEGLDRPSALREAARRLGVTRKVLYTALLGDETDA
jgi:16S rRNA (cytidine1402-2'-O)-methyltransferase